MSAYVLDTSALLAYLWREQGWERVEAVFASEEVVMSAVNATETIAKAIDLGLPEEAAQELQSTFDFEQIPFDEASALDTALLRSKTRHLGLSLGDRACLALAKSRDAVALTADRPWLDLDLGLRIECIR
jgi:PIN domain nuclease of toxin-antitoxin system